MIVYRLCKSIYKDDLSGKGAELAGGRWNNKGLAVLYTSDSKALCTTEIAVHTPLGIIPSDYYIVTIEFPSNAPMQEIFPDKLPPEWKSSPPKAVTKKIGDKFITEGKYLALKVPSVVVQGDFNYLLNPQHKDFRKVKIIKTEAFAFDKRLFS